MFLHPSPNCTLRAESLVHVHFKEEIGIAELIPLVTTYIILFAYIYFSTRKSTAWRLGASSKLTGHSRPPASLPLEVAWGERSDTQGFMPQQSFGGAWVGPWLLWLLRKRPEKRFLGSGSQKTHFFSETGKYMWPSFSLVKPGAVPSSAVRAQSTLRTSAYKGPCESGFGGDAALMCPLCPPGKIDMVKSKWGLALAAVVTVLSSLLMSVGLCTLFGLTPTLNGG